MSFIRLRLLITNDILTQTKHEMKHVFNSNQELATTFAQGSQLYGRTKSMFFEHRTAYSYGHHYIAAKFVTANKGEKVCFLNSRSYSVTTAKHVQKLFIAVNNHPSDIKIFSVPLPRVFDIEQLPTIIRVMTEKAEDYLFKQLKARTTTYNFDLGFRLISDIKEISELFGLPIPSNSSFKNFDKASEKVRLIYNPS